MPSKTNLQLCCAETQTAGRGRFGREWCSPYKKNIYCSLRYSFPCPASAFSGLSLVVSMAIIASLASSIPTHDLRIKWPNDIYWHHKKLCGTLIELIPVTTDKTDIVIGIGMNVHSTLEDMPTLTSSWCSLEMIAVSEPQDRNYIISQFVLFIDKYINVFITEGFTAFIEEWKRLDYLQHQSITVFLSTETLFGKALGIDHDGQLLLQEENGVTRTIFSGEASIKKHS